MASHSKNQPWKANWPPQEVNSSLPSHGCAKGAILVETGDTVSKPRNMAVEPNTNNQESSSKNQPWKADWPPREIDTSLTSHGCPKGAILTETGDTVSKPRKLAAEYDSRNPQE
ncbi:hypothetical protein BOTNAR_0359g00130 [Botryotinia narcissicola]|uniref:Uncharacterized protein n=1 Tax=Botryotinia narcissicola TaxID=278944 RepID=A0A4Z1I304_9HELO|nr:hypothetical protein BOTNAR_0359g00130 [Botryotinia narcissicola]